MKVLLISNMYPSKSHPFFGIFVHNFKVQLEKNNVQFNLAVIKGRETSKLKKILKYSFFFYDVIQKIIKNDYDAVYVHYISFSLFPLLIVRKFINKPLIINAHGSDVLVKSNFSKLIQKLVTPMIKQADLVVVPSVYFKNICLEKFQIKKDHIFVSPSGGIDITIFKPLPVKKDNDIFTIGYVSRIDEGKGWDTLLHAIKHLIEEGVFNIKVNIIGGGSQESEMKNMIRHFKLENYIKYLGQIPHSKLVNYYNMLDIFVFPTRLNESLGLVGLEAMACGIPVVGSNIGGLKDYIISGYNGELFEQGNANELSACLKRIIDLDEASRKAYKRNSLKTAYQYNSTDTNQKLKQKIGELI